MSVKSQAEENLIKEKLVRDNIPKIIKSSGGLPRHRIADEHEYEDLLYKKLEEEILELQEDKNAEELGDVLEVLDSIRVHYNLKSDDISSVASAKREKNGAFHKRIVLEMPLN